MIADFFKEPVIARYFIDGQIIFQAGNTYSVMDAEPEAFVWGSAEESSLATNPSKEIEEKILEIKKSQSEIDAMGCPLIVVGKSRLDDKETLLLTVEKNPKCVVEIAKKDMAEIDLSQLTEDMENEPNPRGFGSPYLVLVDAPYYAFI